MRHARRSLARAANPRQAALITLALVACLALALPVLAQVSSNYDLSWHVIAGGGERMASASHTLAGTTGQPLIGAMASSPGGHTLCSGFWCGDVWPAEAPQRGKLCLPLVVRGE